MILRYYYSFGYKDQHCIVLEYCKKVSMNKHLRNNRGLLPKRNLYPFDD